MTSSLIGFAVEVLYIRMAQKRATKPYGDIQNEYDLEQLKNTQNGKKL